MRGTIKAADVAAIIGKTEGNGGVNDFTRGYFTQSLMGLLGRKLGKPAEELVKQIPCVLSGGTEGVLSPHYVVLSRSGAASSSPHAEAALAIGTALSPPLAAEHVGRSAHIQSVASAVKAAMADAQIASAADVHFVQVKCPCITSARAEAALAQGKSVVTSDPNRSMALARSDLTLKSRSSAVSSRRASEISPKARATPNAPAARASAIERLGSDVTMDLPCASAASARAEVMQGHLTWTK